MIITISGIAGSGKSTVAKMLAEKLGFRHYSIGDIMRAMANERGITLLELGKLAEKDRTIDEELDRRQIQLGKVEDNFVIDSRLGFHFIPHSFKAFLKVSLDEAARRIFTEGRAHEPYIDLNDSMSKIKKRIASEDKRYLSYYGINYHDNSHYDFIIDTTSLSPEGVVLQITKRINLRRAVKAHSKR
ncbi:cytidylate kinase family protein [Candidatus Woesearchaeota archaeon]|nr:cytidylate kinase family protein [Candidatus Woesearchaeota archaeon]